MDDLERVVNDTAAAIDRHVMATMLEKHSVAAHCNAIKRYLLLGQVRLPSTYLSLWHHRVRQHMLRTTKHAVASAVRYSVGRAGRRHIAGVDRMKHASTRCFH